MVMMMVFVMLLLVMVMAIVVTIIIIMVVFVMVMTLQIVQETCAMHMHCSSCQALSDYCRDYYHIYYGVDSDDVVP